MFADENPLMFAEVKEEVEAHKEEPEALKKKGKATKKRWRP